MTLEGFKASLQWVWFRSTAILVVGPTCRHQNAALGVHNPLTQRLWGKTCKLEQKGGKAGRHGSTSDIEKVSRLWGSYFPTEAISLLLLGNYLLLSGCIMPSLLLLMSPWSVLCNNPGINRFNGTFFCCFHKEIPAREDSLKSVKPFDDSFITQATDDMISANALQYMGASRCPPWRQDYGFWWSGSLTNATKRCLY